MERRNALKLFGTALVGGVGGIALTSTPAAAEVKANFSASDVSATTENGFTVYMEPRIRVGWKDLPEKAESVTIEFIEADHKTTIGEKTFTSVSGRENYLEHDFSRMTVFSKENAKSGGTYSEKEEIIVIVTLETATKTYEDTATDSFTWTVKNIDGDDALVQFDGRANTGIDG